jgi:ferredoxin-nitrate reductase
LSYEKLSRGSGIQWPCSDQYPDGKERLYSDGIFNTAYDQCESFTHDLSTGGAMPPEEYKENDPQGRAIILAADYELSSNSPDKKYPLLLTTGRLVYHFHTRTKTGRSPQLNNAAPEVFIQISEQDAKENEVMEGDIIKIESKQGRVEGPARIGGIAPGLVFVPFHYGYWDGNDNFTAANEVIKTSWDPVSKQPHFKYTAVRMSKADSAVEEFVSETKDKLYDTVKGVVQTAKEKLKI